MQSSTRICSATVVSLALVTVGLAQDRSNTQGRPSTRPAARSDQPRQVHKDVSHGQQSAETKGKHTASKRRRRRTGLTAGERLVLRFDRSAPQLGDPLPDVSAHDAQGKQFKLRDVKGHYTVLTFGCLT